MAATLVDISETGALLESGYEFSPGLRVALFVESGPANAALRAVVLRCRQATGYFAQLEFTAEQPEPARIALQRCIDEARHDRPRALVKPGRRPVSR